MLASSLLAGYYFRERERRIPMSPPPPDAYVTPAFSKLITYENIYEVFESIAQNLETVTLRDIKVYSTPLSAPFKSSKPGIRRYLQQQFSPVDYHAFVVFQTSDGMWWALDKIAEGIFVSWGKCRDSVLFNFQLNKNSVKQKFQFYAIYYRINKFTINQFDI